MDFLTPAILLKQQNSPSDDQETLKETCRQTAIRCEEKLLCRMKERMEIYSRIQKCEPVLRDLIKKEDLGSQIPVLSGSAKKNQTNVKRVNYFTTVLVK